MKIRLPVSLNLNVPAAATMPIKPFTAKSESAQYIYALHSGSANEIVPDQGKRSKHGKSGKGRLQWYPSAAKCRLHGNYPSNCTPQPCLLHQTIRPFCFGVLYFEAGKVTVITSFLSKKMADFRNKPD
jgi:hypothetical protein